MDPHTHKMRVERDEEGKFGANILQMFSLAQLWLHAKLPRTNF